MRYQSVTIENFRGISRLDIGDFRRVNLLVGKNNCGKTSVLEAMFLLSGMGNPQLPLNIHTFRDLVLSNDEDFGFMFRNLDFEVPIELNGRVDAHDRKLRLTPFYGIHQPRNGGKESVESVSLSATSNVRVVEGINFDFVTHKNERFHGEFHLKESKVTLPGKYKESLVCSFRGSKNADVVDDKQMENLLVQKKLDSVITVLRGIEPGVQDVRMGARSMVYIDIGAERLLPINVMGDGMRKVLALMAAIAAMKNGVLLIDEIENGLHYSSLSVAWKAILAACKEYNVQLIATTHSDECIEALSESYGSVEPGGDDIRLFRIDKDGETHKAFVFDAKVLRAGIEKGFEVR